MKSKLTLVLMLMLAAFLIAACAPAADPAPPADNVAEVEMPTLDPIDDPAETEDPIDDVPDEEPAVEEDGDVFQIGIINLSDHPALVAASNGFRAAFEEYGINAVFDYQNAAGDRPTLSTIADRFVNNDVDLVLAISTPAVTAMFAATQDIPIVGSAITSYERAEVVYSNEAPGTNVTGASDMNPIRQQIDMIFEFVPDLETLGVAFASSEPNSIYQAEIAIAYAESLGLQVVESTVAAAAEVQQNMLALAADVDAIWIPTDNTHADAMPVVGQVAIDSGVPVFPGEDQMVMGGGVATLSIDYFNLGWESGRMARDILIYGHNPAEMPIRFGMDLDLQYIVNGFMIEELGMETPERFLPYIWYPE